MKKKIILVTGCSGFIGFHTTEFLLKKGFVVIGIDNMNSYYDTKLKYARLSILKKKIILYFLKLIFVIYQKCKKY